METKVLIPEPDSIPVAWGWFQALLTSSFFLHILIMDVMLGIAIISFVHHFQNDTDHSPVCGNIARNLPFTIAFTINFGIAPLLFLQVLYGHLFYTSSLMMASLWLSLFVVLIAAYSLAYVYKYHYDTLRETRVTVSGAISLLLLWTTFIMCNNFTSMQNPESFSRYFEFEAGLMLNLGDPTLIPRFLHIVLSAVAVGGLTIALFFHFKKTTDHRETRQWIHSGCQWFGYTTMLNFVVGFWFLGMLPASAHDVSTANGTFFSLFLIIGTVTGALAIINSLRDQVLKTCWYALASILSMVLMRDLIRASALTSVADPSDLPVTGQYSPMILFFLILGGGVYLVVWMVKLVLNGSADKEARS